MTDFNKLEDLDNKIQQSITSQEQKSDEITDRIFKVHGSILNDFESMIVVRILIFHLLMIAFVLQTSLLINRLETIEQKFWPELLEHASGQSNSSDQVAPVIFNVSNITRKLEDDPFIWHSQSFFAFKDGYEMALVISVSKSIGMRVSLLLLKEAINWLSREMFVAELLNPKNNSDHYYSLVLVGDGILSDCQDTEWDERGLLCTINFIPSSHLIQKSDQYFSNDTMYLRISRDDSFLNLPIWFFYHYYRPNASRFCYSDQTLAVFVLIFTASLFENIQIRNKFGYLILLLSVVVFFYVRKRIAKPFE